MDIQTTNGSLTIQDSKISLSFDENFFCQTAFLTDNGWKSPGTLNPSAENQEPFSFLLLDGQPVNRFHLNAKSCAEKKIVRELGSAVQISFEGIDSESLNSPVQLVLEIEFYDSFPNACLIRARFNFENAISSARYGIALNHLNLDAGQVGGRSPYDFWVYNGSAELREHCLQALTPDYFKRSYLGVLESFEGGGSQPDYRHGSQPGFGGGTPVLAVWNRELGTAIGHLEPLFQRCSLPIRVAQKQSVSIGIFQHLRDCRESLKSLRSFDTFLMHHEGDFYNALECYREMIRSYGVCFSTPSADAYEPQWDTWGFGENFSPEDVLKTIRHLKEMGIKWVTLDDRWFDTAGDWQPRPDRFPGGEKQFIGFVKTLHRQGMKVRLWTIPGEADGNPDLHDWVKKHPTAEVEIQKHPHHSQSKVLEDNPDWIVIDPKGDPELSKRGNYFMCGDLAEVQDYFQNLTRKMFEDWDIDGLKQDAVYMCPGCFSEKHGHDTPDRASEAYGKILRTIFQTAQKFKPDSIIVNCPCGTTLTPDWMQWQNQAISPDPWTSWVNRGIIKQLKALFGPAAAIVMDHIELSDEGQDFSLIGVGAVPATRITPTGQEKTFGTASNLTFKQKKEKWEKWIRLYRELELSKGEYLNLYDLIYDQPETHVIRKDRKLYYSFYPGDPDGLVADQRELYEQKKSSKFFRGTLEFRGLDTDKHYRIYDYENQTELAIIEGNNPVLETEIDHHLLVEVQEL